jgi:hypothetical protein
MENLRQSVAKHNNRPVSNFARAREITELAQAILIHLDTRCAVKTIANNKDPGNPIRVTMISTAALSLVRRALEEILLRSIDLSANVHRLPGRTSRVSTESVESSPDQPTEE